MRSVLIAQLLPLRHHPPVRQKGLLDHRRGLQLLLDCLAAIFRQGPFVQQKMCSTTHQHQNMNQEM